MKYIPMSMISMRVPVDLLQKMDEYIQANSTIYSSRSDLFRSAVEYMISHIVTIQDPHTPDSTPISPRGPSAQDAAPSSLSLGRTTGEGRITRDSNKAPITVDGKEMDNDYEISNVIQLPGSEQRVLRLIDFDE